MTRPYWIAVGLLTVAVSLPCTGAPDAAPAPPGSAEPTAVELLEDLRILAILNVLELTREQTTRLAAVAASARATLASLEREHKEKWDGQRQRLLAARDAALRGAEPPRATHQIVVNAGESAQALRTQKTEALLRALALQVRAILTAEQAERVEAELAPSGEQPWRRYSRLLAGPGAPRQNSARLPVDPGYWLKELRDLRIDSAEGDPAHEIEDFGKKLSRNLKSGSPLSQDMAAQGRTIAAQVLAMPPDLFAAREWQLARMVAKQDREARNRQRTQDGKPVESFDAARWLVEEVLVSPRAAPVLKDRARSQ